MTGNARRKIDSYTQQMFDPEVDKPQHDQILTTLFTHEDAVVKLITELNGLGPMCPISEIGEFEVKEWTGESVRKVDLATAQELAGPSPQFKSMSPIRIKKKELEVIMNYTTDQERRYERLVGFIDMGVLYEVLRTPRLISTKKDKYEWQVPRDARSLLIEVKSAWPTAGNLLRQLNLYYESRPSGFHQRTERQNLVVGPDDSMNALVNEHGYRLVTFDEAGKNFTLVPRVRTGAGKGTDLI